MPDDRELFNEDLTGIETYEGCSSVSAEMVVVTDGADITFIAPTIELGSGFTVEVGASFTAANGTPAGCP